MKIIKESEKSIGVNKVSPYIISLIISNSMSCRKHIYIKVFKFKLDILFSTLFRVSKMSE